MPVNTLVNQRKDNLGNWIPIQDSETHVVSTTSPYIITLSERPASGLDIPSTTPPAIDGLARTENPQAIASGEFYVNFQTGVITFHSSKAGQSVTISYWKTGSVISAEQINTIKDRLVHADADPTDQDKDYEIGTIWVSTISDPILGIVRRIWILSDINDTLDTAIWVPQGDSLAVKNDLGEETSVRVFRSGRIEFEVLSEPCGCFDCQKDFFVYNLGPTPGFVKNDEFGRLIGGQIVDLSELEVDAVAPIYKTGRIIGHDSTSGAMHIPSGGTSGQALVWVSDGTAAWATMSAGTAYLAELPIILDGVTFKHSSAAGYIHIPSGGSSGQYLQYGGSSGTASWKSINTSITLSPGSDTEIPSQLAVKTYVDSQISSFESYWEQISFSTFGTTLVPRTRSHNVLSSTNLFVDSNDYTGARIGLSITHDASGATDSGIVFSSNKLECLRILDTTADFANIVSITGNLNKVRNVPYTWPASQATSFSFLSNAGATGVLTWKLVSTDGLFTANSDLEVPSQRAIKTYVDGKSFWTRSLGVLSPSTVSDVVSAPTGLRAGYMASAGIVKNDSSGNLGGGNKILTTDLTSGFTLSVTNGGSGLTSVTDGKILIGSGSNTYEIALLQGTANQVILSRGTSGSDRYVRFGTPQDIATTSSPTFRSVSSITTGASEHIGFSYTSDTSSFLGYRVGFRGVTLTGASLTYFALAGNISSKPMLYGYGDITGFSNPQNGTNVSTAAGIWIGNINNDSSAGAYKRAAYGLRIGDIGNSNLQGEAVGLEIGTVTSSSAGFFNLFDATTPNTVGIRVGEVSGGKSPLAINTKGGSSLFENCMYLSIKGKNYGFSTELSSAYISLDRTSYSDGTTGSLSWAGIRFLRDSELIWELKTKKTTVPAGKYPYNTLMGVDNFEIHSLKPDGSYQNSYGLPILSISRGGGMVFRTPSVFATTSLSAEGSTWEFDDKFRVLPITNPQPGSFETFAGWTIYPVGSIVATKLTNDYPPDTQKQLYYSNDYTGADHHKNCCCSVLQNASPGGYCGQYYTFGSNFVPGQMMRLTYRVKYVSGISNPNMVRFGDGSGNWYDVSIIPQGAAKYGNSLWGLENVLIIVPRQAIGCNRFWIGAYNSPSLHEYRITWVDLRVYDPTSAYAAMFTCAGEARFGHKMAIGNLMINPNQTAPANSADPTGEYGEVRIIPDVGAGDAAMYVKNGVGWRRALFSTF